MPVQPVVVRHEHVPIVPLQEPKSEPKELTPAAKVEPGKIPKPEEKTSEWKKKPPKSEEKASNTHKKRKFRYEGEGGRIHTEAQIDEILDFWLMTGELPTYVSNRQRYDYRHHERLPERRELLEQRGISVVVTVPGTTGRTQNVIPLKGAKPQRKTGNRRRVR